ncbi:hypothetical protein HPG69_011938, partial [Diceros bicornis minor]
FVFLHSSMSSKPSQPSGSSFGVTATGVGYPNGFDGFQMKETSKEWLLDSKFCWSEVIQPVMQCLEMQQSRLCPEPVLVPPMPNGQQLTVWLCALFENRDKLRPKDSVNWFETQGWNTTLHKIGFDPINHDNERLWGVIIRDDIHMEGYTDVLSM